MKCNDDHSDFWVGPATPTLLTSWNFFPSFQGHTLANTVHPFHFFFIFHICALMGTLLMMDSVFVSPFYLALHQQWFICVSQDLIFYFTLQLKMQLRIRYRVSVKLNTQNQFSSSPDETCRKLCVLTDLHILEQTITKFVS